MKNSLLVMLLFVAMPFQLQAAATKITASWVNSTTYTDGSPLTIAGYKIFFAIDKDVDATATVINLTGVKTSHEWFTDLTTNADHTINAKMLVYDEALTESALTPQASIVKHIGSPLKIPSVVIDVKISITCDATECVISEVVPAVSR